MEQPQPQTAELGQGQIPGHPGFPPPPPQMMTRQPTPIKRDIIDHHEFLLSKKICNIPPQIERCGPAPRRPTEGRIHRNPRTQKLIETNMFPMDVKIEHVWVFQINGPFSMP